MTEHLQRIKTRLHDYWLRQDYKSAGEVIGVDFVAVLKSAAQGAGLSYADSEEAAGQATERFYRKVARYGEVSITDPWAYLWRATNTAIADCFRGKREAALPETSLLFEQAPLEGLSESTPSGVEEQVPHGLLDQMANAAIDNVPPPSPQVLLESFFEEMDLAESEGPGLVAATIRTLSPAAAETISAILAHGPQQAAMNALMGGITPGAFRVRKFRAYKEFKKACPQVAASLNITWRGIDHPETA